MQNYWDTKIQKKSDSYWDKMEPERSSEISYVNHTNNANIWLLIVEKDPLCELKPLGDDSKCFGFMAVDYS